MSRDSYDHDRIFNGEDEIKPENPQATPVIAKVEFDHRPKAMARFRQVKAAPLPPNAAGFTSGFDFLPKKTRLSGDKFPRPFLNFL